MDYSLYRNLRLHKAHKNRSQAGLFVLLEPFQLIFGNINNFNNTFYREYILRTLYTSSSAHTKKKNNKVFHPCSVFFFFNLPTLLQEWNSINIVTVFMSQIAPRINIKHLILKVSLVKCNFSAPHKECTLT